MQLKSIEIKNFRQFIDETVEFSTNSSQNVTLIVGDNGSGKTAFMNAIVWCLWGINKFPDKKLVNNIEMDNMLIGKTIDIVVKLTFVHSEIEYIVERREMYKKDSSDSISPVGHPKTKMWKKNVDGTTDVIEDTYKIPPHIKQILPEELSEYFFFDGERIEKMSNEIQKGKGDSFKDAVTKLLGLDGHRLAMKHLVDSNTSVISKYEANLSADMKNNSNFMKCKENIDQLKSKLENIRKQISYIEEEIKIADVNISSLNNKLREHDESKKLYEEIEESERNIKEIERSKAEIKEKMLNDFNIKFQGYFARSYILKALKMLNNAKELTSKYNPINIKIIKYLLNRGNCICGTHLDSGSDAYNTLKKLETFPKINGMSVEEFIEKSEKISDDAKDLYESFTANYKKIGDYEAKIINKRYEIENIKIRLEEYKDAAVLEKKLKEDNIKKERLIKERDELVFNEKNTSNEIEIENKKLLNFTSKEPKNELIKKYIAYAEYLYEKVKNDYSKEENNVRNALQEMTNVIFKNIFDGNFELILDDKYNIKPKSGIKDIDFSTAQNAALIFAFIAAIIEVRHSLKNEIDGNSKNLESYPLVMDAPLSTLDTTRTKIICETMPRIAEQVIIFINDKDGNLVEKHISSKIGVRKDFKKIEEFITKIV